MTIIKPVAVIIRNNKYLVARDRGEDFFKNVGGRIENNETELECLKRNLQSEIGLTLTEEPTLVFDFPPTPAQGDPGDFVILRGFFIKEDTLTDLILDSDTEEVAWINTLNAKEYTLTPQIKNLILPKLVELGLIK